MKTTKRLKKFAQLLMAFFCWLTFFVGVLVFANWPEPPKDAIFGGWLWEVFNLNESGTGKLVLNAKQVVLPDDADKIENPAQLATKQYVDDHAVGSLGGAKKLIQDFVVATGATVTAGDVVHFFNGTVRKGINDTAVSESVFNSSSTGYPVVATLDSTHFVVAYVGDGYGKAIIGTLSGNIITYGSEFIFNQTQTHYLSITALDSNHFVVAYQDDGNGYYGTSIVGTVNGTDITYGSESVFNSAITYETAITALDSTHFVVAYKDWWNWTTSYGKSKGAIVYSETSIVFESSAKTFSTRSNDFSIIALDSTHFFIAYADRNYSNYGKAVVGYISSNSISLWTESIFNLANTAFISIDKLDENHVIIAYLQDHSLLTKIAIISGMNITAYNSSSEATTTTALNYINISALDSSHFVLTYAAADNNYGKAVIGTISDYIVTYGEKSVFNISETNFISTAVLDSNHFITTYQDGGNHYYGTVALGSLPLESDFNSRVGIAQESALAWESVAILTHWVSDIHSELEVDEIYYTDLRGNLSTNKSDYQIGFAISETELLINTDSTSENQYFGDMIFANNFRITEDWESPQGLIFKNQLSRDVLHLDENGALTADELNWKKLKIGNANQEKCDSSNYGAIKYENDNFYGCKSSGWVPFTN